MPQVILDLVLAKQLNALGQAAELCDPSGQIVGRFVPIVHAADWEALSPDVSEDELERRSKSNDKRYTTAEVLAHLEKL